MDKRFFLALFLSLIVIAISQLLFPPARPKPGSQTTVTRDSAALSASSTATGQRAPSQATASSIQSASPAVTRNDSAAVAKPASVETTTVTVPKAIYRFSNV